MTSKYGAAQDTISSLKHAFDKLKKESGKSADFSYPELELEQEMLGENSRLQSQLLEAEDQISALEIENTRVRKAMKNQAGLIGEQGFKFLGMDSESLVLVNEFASNLREGKMELPLNDRSVNLLKENKKLKDDQKSMSLRVERYEREISGSIGPSQILEGSGSGSVAILPQISGLNKIQEAELFGLRNDVQKLLNEKDTLHHRMTSMQAELMYTLRTKSDDKNNQNNQNNNEIAIALAQANESLMKELFELRAQSAPQRRGSGSLSDIELPPGSGLSNQYFNQSQTQNQFQNQTQGLYSGGIAGGPGGNGPGTGSGTGSRFNSRLPPAGGRRSGLQLNTTANTLRVGDQHSDVMYTPGTYVLYCTTLHFTFIDTTDESTHCSLANRST